MVEHMFEGFDTGRDYEVEEFAAAPPDRAGSMQFSAQVAEEHLSLVAAEHRALLARLRHFERVLHSRPDVRWNRVVDRLAGVPSRHDPVAAREMVRVADAIP